MIPASRVALPNKWVPVYRYIQTIIINGYRYEFQDSYRYIQTIVTYCTIKNTKQLLMTMRNEE